MSERQRQLRLVFFLLLSAAVVATVVSCQAPQGVEVAAFDQLPGVLHERQTADIGHRLRDMNQNGVGKVEYAEYLTFAQSFGFSYAAAGRKFNADGTARTPENVNDDSQSCIKCHNSMSDSFSGQDPKRRAYHNMHDPAKFMGLAISCVDCHGGNGDQFTEEKAHVHPNDATRAMWEDPTDPSRISPAAPKVPEAKTLKESLDFIRFVNPGDLRASWVSCYACHSDVVEKVSMSMMVHGDMLWQAALYNNGTINRKNAIYGEFYDWQNTPARVVAQPQPTPAQTKRFGWLPELWPLPRWEVAQPGNILRVFEQGGERRPVIGIPDPEEDPGRPDVKLSLRGFGTEVRTDPVLIGLQKTRLLDPTLTLFGTNDHPGDFRASGCSACHVVYANDRSPVHSGMWAKYGNMGQTASSDVSMVDHKQESGHPVLHYFVQQMPVSTCIVCHIHPGTNVLNEYTGFMWWDNETDGKLMYPAKQRNPDGADEYVSWRHNPEGAAVRGLWSNLAEFGETAEQRAKFSNEQDQLGRTVADDFLDRVSELNKDPQLKHTTFADFHGHGWVFRAVYKKDRYGNLLDADGRIIPSVTREDLTDATEYQQQFDDKGKLLNPYPDQKPVHLKDIHLEMGMQCADCHFEQDNHGDGHLYGETRDAVAEDCVDCHGTAEKASILYQYLQEGQDYDPDAVNTDQQKIDTLPKKIAADQKALAKATPATKSRLTAALKKDQNALKSAKTALANDQRIGSEYNGIWSGAGAYGSPGPYDLKHFTIKDNRLYQINLAYQPGSNLPKGWFVTQTADTLDKSSAWAKSAATRPWLSDDGKADGNHFERAAYAHSVRRDMTWGAPPDPADTSVPASRQLAHPNSTVSCYACHTSWNTSCFGCHLPQRANEQKDMLHNEGTETRNYTTYNYQTLRDDMYMLGDDGTVKGHKVVPVRSACAVLVSSQDALRRWIYVQQQTVSAEGLAGTAFSPYFPHTVRATETRQCSDCHMHKDADGHVDNNAVMAQLLMQGVNAYNFIGRFCWVGCGDDGLQAIAVTERDEPQAVFGSRLHEEAFPDNYKRHVANGLNLTEAYEHTGQVLDVQQRGEYCYAACGPNGFIAYDVANIDDKDFSERISLAPVSPLGQRFYIPSQDATSICSPSTLALNPAKQLGDQHRPENEEQPISLMYAFLYLTDAKEGLIVIGNPLDSPNGPGVSTLLDGNPQNNFLERAVTFNPANILAGARHCDLYGTYAWISCNAGIVIVDLKDPLHPRVVTTLAETRLPRKVQFQFRYAFVVDSQGLKVFDVTNPESPVRVASADTAIADARDIYISRTYAYIAGGQQGMLIYNVERPEVPKLDQVFSVDPATGIKLDDVTAIRIGMTNASMYAYVADGRNGLRVLQMTSSDDRDADPGHSDWQFLGFSPHPHPRLIAQFHTPGPAISISKGLDRDRAVDESGNQLSVFGRRGAHPFTLEEQQRMYLLQSDDGKRYPFFVQDNPPSDTHIYKAPGG